MYERSFIRILIISLFAFLGMLIGILLVPAMEDSGILYISGAGALLITIILIIFARKYIHREHKVIETAGTGKKDSEVGFVVDTFQDLMAKLKEKEKELEKLKSFAEEKAVRIEAYNENVLQSVPSGVIGIDNAVCIKSVNQAAERILGIDAADAIGKRFDEVFREPLTVILNETDTVARMECPYTTDDKRHVWLGITTSQLINSAGEKVGLIFVFSDLTDIKALQSQVELKERLSQLGEMSAGISHELRNSMAVISGYAKLLSKKVDTSCQGTVDAIQAEIKSMDLIITELLAFAKPTVLNTEEVLINDLLKETVNTAIGGNDSIRVSIRESGAVYINADKVLLRQALHNLIANAVEAMPEGGSIEIGIVPSHGKAEISIKDSGAGIPEDIKSKIFLPFFTTKEKGIGFGLALVQKIIVSHGGSIEVESKEDEGSVFRIILPALP